MEHNNAVGKRNPAARMHWLSLGLLICFCGGQLQAATFTQTLNYGATDASIWGENAGQVGFDFTESLGFGLPLGLGDVSVGYSVVANSGTVSVDFDGSMDVGYQESLAAPGIANLNLSYQGAGPTSTPPICIFGVCIPGISIPSGSLNSDFGARAQLTSSVGNVGPDFTLEIDKVFSPGLGNVISGEDSVTAAQVPVIDVLVAAAGVQMGVTQNSSFVANSVEGNLKYSRQGSGVTDTLAFSLDEFGLSLDVDLPEAGVWDFWFEDQTLDNDFSTAFDLDLGVFASTVAGCGFLLLESCEATADLLSLEILSIFPFPLAFNSITNLNGFSIEVAELISAVPVPAAFWLFGSALLGFVGMSRRRHPG